MPTQQEIADHLDINQSEVSRHMATLGLDWKVASMDSIRVAYLRHLRGMAAGHKSESGDDLVKERVLTERVDREIKLYTLAEKKGQLVNVAQLEPELMQMVSAFRSELLSRDDKLKADLDALHGIDIDLQILNAHTHNALAHLARYDVQRAGVHPAPGGFDQAAGVDDHHRVGAPPSPYVGEGHGSAGPLQP